jgi:hypothetical protein
VNHESESVGLWPADDLVRRVERSLDMAANAIQLLKDEPELDLEALEAPPDKVVAETAMLLRACASVPTEVAPGVSHRTSELALELIPYARGPRILAGIALHPALAYDYAAAHLVLAAAGWPDPEVDALLDASLAPSAGAARERLPHRELEQDWLRWLHGGPVSKPGRLARTAVGTGIDLLSGSRDDVYAFTHALLYAADFGGKRIRLPRPLSCVLTEARSALAGALDDDDFDLAGELLLAWPLLKSKWEATSSFAFAVLTRVEDEVGLLPSLAIDAEGYRTQPQALRRH